MWSFSRSKGALSAISSFSIFPLFAAEPLPPPSPPPAAASHPASQPAPCTAATPLAERHGHGPPHRTTIRPKGRTRALWSRLAWCQAPPNPILPYCALPERHTLTQEHEDRRGRVRGRTRAHATDGRASSCHMHTLPPPPSTPSDGYVRGNVTATPVLLMRDARTHARMLTLPVRFVKGCNKVIYVMYHAFEHRRFVIPVQFRVLVLEQPAFMGN
uniref:Putative secreted protein n=1 Tax=Anopheles darlingi TaxID=43151 RepID=A0A2M4DJD4_ANODA